MRVENNNNTNEKYKQTMVFKVGNDQIKLNPGIVRKYLVNGQGAVTDQEIVYFMHLCKSRQLNPFTKEAYLIKYGQEPATMVVARDALEKRAIKNVQYNGKKVGIYVMNKETNELIKRDGTIYIKETEKLIGAWCTVYRRDWENPVSIEVNLDEYIGRKKDGTANANWTNKPVTMITKVAKAQALREAFIEELEGMYEQEEVNVNLNDIPEAEVIPVDTEEDNTQDYTENKDNDLTADDIF